MILACTVEDPNYGGRDTGSSGSAGELSTTAVAPTTTGAAVSTSSASGVASSASGVASSGTSVATSTADSNTQTDGPAAGCRGDGDCVAPNAACDVPSGDCVECTSNAHCGGLRSACDLDLQVCQECLDATGCPGGVCITGACEPYATPCEDDSMCNTVTGMTCCVENQCADTCTIPCVYSDECPPKTECAHGSCLLRCANTDEDCEMLEGYTCQHPVARANTLCEAD